MSNSNSRDEWDALWEVTSRPVPTPAERDEHTALRDAVAAERAAVVAWLRERAEAIRKGEYEPANRENALELTAISIERGEHRREETK